MRTNYVPRNPEICAVGFRFTQVIRRSWALCSLGGAGREVLLDEAVYRSESETGHRNRAIGYMLRNFGILTTYYFPEGSGRIYTSTNSGATWRQTSAPSNEN